MERLCQKLSRHSSVNNTSSRGYGGLIPEWFKYGALDKYFLGELENDSYFAGVNRVYLLGCGDRGDVGCWPLKARVRAEGESVVWDSFEQPHRKGRD